MANIFEPVVVDILKLIREQVRTVQEKQKTVKVRPKIRKFGIMSEDQ